MPSRIDEIVTFADLPERLAVSLRLHDREHRAGREFAPELSYGRHFGPSPENARSAAVIALLYLREGAWHVPLTVRPPALGRHGGQISLPGGSVDPGETTQAAALRELSEELGIGESIELVGQLRESYVFVSNFRVTPWVAVARDAPKWQPQTSEVERVVEMPLVSLFDQGCVRTVTIQHGPVEFRAKCYQFSENCVWGATSTILGQLAGLIRRAAKDADFDA